MKPDIFASCLQLLNKLDEAQIAYTLAHHREDALMVMVAVPGERWEIEFLRDGAIEVERFVSRGEIDDGNVLSELFAIYANSSQNGQNHSPLVAMYATSS